ncbi:DUF7146 domain-containing protein [Falsihalocynthiibacter arcticus]|uniref:DUF7146 domain-containing protein n=1 Tax=Falsihalocynthiibacter arcticus TaxID=1579316 RepID=UPI0030034ADA
MERDSRLDLARAQPIGEVADRLGLTLKKITSTERAGPCPSCGGRDRFAINTARNVFNCRKCGAKGDQCALVMLALGCDFKSALSYLAGERDVTLDPAEVARRRARADEARAKAEEYEARARARAIRDAREIWHKADGGDLGPARAYLAGRGLFFKTWPPTLRCVADHPYVLGGGAKAVEHHRGPCLIAAVQNAAGQIRAVHQTWFDPARPGTKAQIQDAALYGPSKPLVAKLVRGSKKGGAIRLTPAPALGGVLVMGEGIETTASAMMIEAVPGAAYWAGVDLGNMAGLMAKIPGTRNSGLPDLTDARAFTPPFGLSRLIYLMDGDSAPAATRAKLLSGLRRALHKNPQLRAEIVAAPAGLDFNDLINGARYGAPPQEK